MADIHEFSRVRFPARFRRDAGAVLSLFRERGEEWIHTIRVIHREELHREPSDFEIKEHLYLIQTGADGGWTAEKIRESVRALEEWHRLHPPKPLIEFPDRDTLRRFRGDLCGIRIPDLPHGRDNVLFTPAYKVYDAETRARVRDAYKARGYTHFPVGAPNADVYRGLYPHVPHTPDMWADMLEELWINGLIPVVFMIEDLPRWDDHQAQLMPYLTHPRLQELIKVAAVGWETNMFMKGDVLQKCIDLIKEHLPECLLYVHFTSGHACGADETTPGLNERGWWEHQIGKLQGILYQHGPEFDAASLQDRLQDFTIRFQNGHNGWPKGHFDTVAFEYSAYYDFWKGQDEAVGIRKGDAAMQVDGVIGFCDGGTVR